MTWLYSLLIVLLLTLFYHIGRWLFNHLFDILVFIVVVVEDKFHPDWNKLCTGVFIFLFIFLATILVHFVFFDIADAYRRTVLKG